MIGDVHVQGGFRKATAGYSFALTANGRALSRQLRSSAALRQLPRRRHLLGLPDTTAAIVARYPTLEIGDMIEFTVVTITAGSNVTLYTGQGWALAASSTTRIGLVCTQLYTGTGSSNASVLLFTAYQLA